ncbi:MAG: hypothetical protein SOZ18_02440 [Phocaeicola sp.]|nr:hypothetical protein [Phocaeicola sp.]
MYTIYLLLKFGIVYEYIIYYTMFKQRIPIGDLLLSGQMFGVKRRTLPICVHKNNAIGIVLREM